VSWDLNQHSHQSQFSDLPAKQGICPIIALNYTFTKVIEVKLLYEQSRVGMSP
jgi:hypothetical protein